MIFAFLASLAIHAGMLGLPTQESATAAGYAIWPPRKIEVSFRPARADLPARGDVTVSAPKKIEELAPDPPDIRSVKLELLPHRPQPGPVVRGETPPKFAFPPDFSTAETFFPELFTGTVSYRTWVSASGKLLRTELLSADNTLSPAAVRQVERTIQTSFFKPATRNGVAVEGSFVVVVGGPAASDHKP